VWSVEWSSTTVISNLSFGYLSAINDSRHSEILCSSFLAAMMMEKFCFVFGWEGIMVSL
jgi:hypothetical protein